MHNPSRRRWFGDQAGARADRGAFAAQRSTARDRAVLVGLTLLGLAARVPGIAHQPLQWDEGWSIALARLPVADALRLTALDVHPPLYYGLLHAWTGAIGMTPLAVRALSLLTASIAVPLSAAAARAWWPAGAANARARRWAGWAAATATAFAPPLVYYAGIGRMYALAAVGVLAATWGVGDWLTAGEARAVRAGGRRAGARRGSLGFGVAVAGSAGALLSFYYSGFALAGIGLAALVARRGAWRRWLAWVAATAVLVAPWLIFAVPQLAARMGARAAVDRAAGDAAGDAAGTSLTALLGDAWQAVLFVNTGGALLAAVVALALVGALVLALFNVPADTPADAPAVASARGRLTATVLPVLLVCTAAALGARAHMFAPRYVSVATPFVALGIGWAAAGAVRRRWPAGLAAVALVAAAWPTLSGAIYARSAEWFEAYDSEAVYRAVVHASTQEGTIRPWDVLAFNILSQAGAYDSAAAADPRSAGSGPSWTFGQLWDPVHEPVKAAIRRVEQAYEGALRGEDPGTVDPKSARSQARARVPGLAALWLVLYKGSAASDTAALKSWADDEYFPIGGSWVGDTLLAGYVDAPTDATRRFEPAMAFGAGIELRQARYTSRAVARGNVAVILRWRATQAVVRDARVVVRLVDVDGRTASQRDAVPVSESRPTTSWRAGESLDDRHGLRLGTGTRGTLRIVVGLVDVVSGALWHEVDVGTVEVVDDRADAYRH